jgi:hypothetical protein
MGDFQGRGNARKMAANILILNQLIEGERFHGIVIEL